MTTPEYISYIFAWHSLGDACPKCQRLNGREWRDQDLFQNTLWDSFEGNIWNLDADHTLAHPNCRCQLEVRVHTTPLTEEILLTLKEELRNLATSLRAYLDATKDM